MKICRLIILLFPLAVPVTPTLQAGQSDEKEYAGATLSEWKTYLETIDPNAEDRGRWVPGLIALLSDESLSSNDRRRFGLRLARMKTAAAPAVPVFVRILKQRDQNRDYLWAARALGLMGKTAAPAP